MLLGQRSHWQVYSVARWCPAAMTISAINRVSRSEGKQTLLEKAGVRSQEPAHERIRNQSLTIFTIPKPFRGHSGVIQRNAIESWRRLPGRPQVVICGDEPGACEIAAEFNLTHVRNVARNEYRTPFLHSTLEHVRRIATGDLLCYVNADIILMDDFATALESISFERFMMVGRRWDFDLNEPWDFDSPDWQQRLRECVRLKGQQHSAWGIDYFVFPRTGVIDRMPPFVVGRPGWDNWMIFHARKMRVPVIDASACVQAVHQNHDYQHVPMRTGERWVGPEAERQVQLLFELMDGNTMRFAIVDATHVSTANGLARAMGLRELRRAWATLGVLHPRLKPLVRTLQPLVHCADIAWRWMHPRRT